MKHHETAANAVDVSCGVNQHGYDPVGILEIMQLHRMRSLGHWNILEIPCCKCGYHSNSVSRELKVIVHVGYHLGGSINCSTPNWLLWQTNIFDGFGVIHFVDDPRSMYVLCRGLIRSAGRDMGLLMNRSPRWRP